MLNLFNRLPLVWLDRRIREDYARNIPLVLGKLVTSKSPRFSENLLICLSSLPIEIIEKHPSLRAYFLNGDLPLPSVYANIGLCKTAIRLCFFAK